MPLCWKGTFLTAKLEVPCDRSLLLWLPRKSCSPWGKQTRVVAPEPASRMPSGVYAGFKYLSPPASFAQGGISSEWSPVGEASFLSMCYVLRPRRIQLPLRPLCSALQEFQKVPSESILAFIFSWVITCWSWVFFFVLLCFFCFVWLIFVWVIFFKHLDRRFAGKWMF